VRVRRGSGRGRSARSPGAVMRENVEWYALPRVPLQEAYSYARPSAARSRPSPDVAGGAALGMERRPCSPTIPRVIPVIGWPFPGPSAAAARRAQRHAPGPHGPAHARVPCGSTMRMRACRCARSAPGCARGVTRWRPTSGKATAAPSCLTCRARGSLWQRRGGAG